MKIRCNLDFDARTDLGLIDIVDTETGEVLKTAEDAVAEACLEHPALRPCALHRWVEKRRGCMRGKRGRCEHCLEVIEE